jgi:hypothetical protein
MKAEKALNEFKNEPFTDFTKEENAREMRAAIERVKSMPILTRKIWSTARSKRRPQLFKLGKRLRPKSAPNICFAPPL